MVRETIINKNLIWLGKKNEKQKEVELQKKNRADIELRREN